MLSPGVLRIHALACWTLIALGVGHGLGTLVDVFTPTFFTPRDPQVLADMRATPVALGAWLGVERLSVWSLHLGLNFSMALGFIIPGAVQLLLRRANPRLLTATPIVPLATVLSLLWVVLAATCWFWVPLLGFVVATLGFAYTWYALRGVASPTRPPAAAVRLLWLGVLGMGLAGTLHGLGTFPDIFTNGPFSPVSTEVRRAMEQTDLALPAMFGTSTSTWRAYVGFNLGHGLGVFGFALTACLLARHLPGVLARDRALQALFVIASALWFAVSLTFWFYAPTAMTAVALACNLALFLRGRRLACPGPDGGHAFAAFLAARAQR